MRVLLTSQVLGGVGVGSGVSVVGLLAYELSGKESLSGLSSTSATVGTALIAIPMARMAANYGRRPGLVMGYGIGALGAGVAILAAILHLFPLHILASLLFGASGASNLQARFAATDLAQAEHRGRTLSTVVWATTIGAVAGPNLTGPGERVAHVLGIPDLAGAYTFSLVAFASAALVQHFGLRPDPLLEARKRSGLTGSQAVHGKIKDALAIIQRNPRAKFAVASIAAAHAVMVGTMVMTPVHMKHDGAALHLVGLTISLHIAGMYALSPLVGRLADRIGHIPTIGFGGIQFVVAALLVATSDSKGSLPFITGMIILGTAWSCGLVAGSTLLVSSVELQDRPAVQGFNDLVMNLAGGGAGILAGIILGIGGYQLLAYSALLALLVPALTLLRNRTILAAV